MVKRESIETDSYKSDFSTSTMFPPGTHFECSTKRGMATCHEVVIREKSGLEVVNADKFAVFVAESGSHKHIGFLSYNPPVLHGKTLVRLVHVV